MVNILVVEDDKNLRRLMSDFLKQSGYNAIPAADGEEALDIMDSKHIDMIVSDIMMPNIDGFELTESLRQSNYNLPILFVTAKESFEDKRKGFVMGVDDYMVKPIDMEEMLLRITALLRRARIAADEVLEVGKVILLYNALTVSRNNESVLLPQKEFYLLYKLLSYPSKTFTRFQLMDEIWGMDTESGERTVDVHIKRLRQRFKEYSEFEIVTVRGLGYKAVIKI